MVNPDKAGNAVPDEPLVERILRGFAITWPELVTKPALLIPLFMLPVAIPLCPEIFLNVCNQSTPNSKLLVSCSCPITVER